MPKAKPPVKRVPSKTTKVPPKAGGRIPGESAAEYKARQAEEKRMKSRK
jgi:hypothetical protein